MSTPRTPAANILTHDDVISLVGDLDAGTIASIIGTGATYADVQQALTLFGTDTETLRHRPLSPAAEAVHDILSVDPSFNEADARTR